MPVAPAIPISSGRLCQFSILSLALPGRAVHGHWSFPVRSLRQRPAVQAARRLGMHWARMKMTRNTWLRWTTISACESERWARRHFCSRSKTAFPGSCASARGKHVAVTNPSRTLQRLFDVHVDAGVRKFVTHLPLYSLRAAATRFGEDAEVEELDWLRAPEGLRLTEGMFVAQVVGRSMEPLIPDGSYCIFRAPVVVRGRGNGCSSRKSERRDRAARSRSSGIPAARAGLRNTSGRTRPSGWNR